MVGARSEPSLVPVTIDFAVNGAPVSVPDDGASLLEALRDRLGIRSPKDGCSPQGQCGCCTVLVDGAPRVSCVTPVRRVRDRSVVTLEGLEPGEREEWAEAFCATGASQCGFCTPGIIVRFSGLRAKSPDAGPAEVERALQAHFCRCTGWQTIVEAYAQYGTVPEGRDLEAASRRATIEGRSAQAVGPDISEGRGGFADDTAPQDALVAVLDGQGGWVVAETITEARLAAGKVQGRRTTIDEVAPIDPPAGDWYRTLATGWVEPAYLELDASWAGPGVEPADPLANGGAFGAKTDSPVTSIARRLADEHGRAVRVLYSREDSVRLGPKRPPFAAGIRADGTGVLRLARTAGAVERIARHLPGFQVEEVDVVGPPTSVDARAFGWGEAAILRAAMGGGPGWVVSPDGARAQVDIDDGVVSVKVRCGEVLDAVVLRSYCIGAVHMALGWAGSEVLTVDAQGMIHDLTVRSFGALRAAEMPEVNIEIEPGKGAAVNGSDAVFAATAAAAWAFQGFPARWPAPLMMRSTAP